MSGNDDPDPRYGDDDDGFALRLGVQPKRTVREHIGIAAAAAGNAGSNAHPTLEAAWYAASLGNAPDQPRGVVAPEVEAGVYARDGGLVVLRSGRRRLTMDIGPLGYLSIAAHGHADALAVTLSSEGRDLIVDPGTASYYGNPAWRAAHRSTRAHPTVCVDGLDQSVMGGAFLWSRHADVKVRSVDLDRGIVDAEHNGYLRLDDPVVHRRWLIAPHGLATVVVVDLIDGRAEHDVAVSWPLHPELDVTPTGDGHLVTRDDEPVLQLSHAATATIELQRVKGDTETNLGWFSDRLESQDPVVAGGCEMQGLRAGGRADPHADSRRRGDNRCGDINGWRKGDRHMVREWRRTRIDDRPCHVRCHCERPVFAARNGGEHLVSNQQIAVSVFGLGYVGCVSAACLASRGHRVVGVDVNRQKLDDLRQGRAPVVEERIGELTAEVVTRAI